MNTQKTTCCTAIDITESDVVSAMKEIQGYIDISPSDFKEVFRIAYTHAMRRLMVSRVARDIMTAPVLCLRADMDLVEAANFLADTRFSGAPVIGASGEIVGVLSEKDFLARMGISQPLSFMRIVAHCLTNKGCMAMALRKHAVAEMMSTPPITASPDVSIAAISQVFMENRINRLPVIDLDGRPVGIVTRTDLVQSYCLPEGGHS